MNLSQGQMDEDLCDGGLHAGFTIVGVFFMVLVMCGCLLGNGVVCLSVFKFRSLQTPSHCLVVSLAVADILVSLIVIPFDVVYWLQFPHWTLGGYVCNFWNSAFFLSMTASALNMLAISVDRFVAVVYPLRYQSLVTVAVTKYIVTAVWAYSFTIAVLIFAMLTPPQTPVYTFDLNPIFESYLILGNILPFLIMMVMNTKVYQIARRHLKLMGRSRVNRVTPACLNSAAPRGQFRRELRVAKALGIVFVGFVVFWLPFEIISLVILFNGNTCALEIADTILCWLAYLHSALNPVVYGLTITQFRRAFRNIVCCKTGLHLDSYATSGSYHRHSTARLKTANESHPNGDAVA